jgi:hypothetical protein
MDERLRDALFLQHSVAQQRGRWWARTQQPRAVSDLNAER